MSRSGPYVVGVYIGHDAGLAIVGPDCLVHLELERFNRHRHSSGLVDELYPIALKLAGIEHKDVVAVAGASGSLGCSLETWTDYNELHDVGPRSVEDVWRGLPQYNVAHHTGHLAYAFYSSPFRDAAIMALDGGGDGFTPPFLPHGAADAAVGYGIGRQMEAMWVAPHWIGGAWNNASREIFGAEYQEGRVMALHGASTADTGFNPVTHDRVRALQKWTTITIERLGLGLRSSPQFLNICMAGGVALNGIATNFLLESLAPDGSVHVPPAVHDGGICIGAAQLVYHRVCKGERLLPHHTQLAFCGYTEPELDAMPDVGRIAEALAAGKIVGVAYGQAESGPRALGHRSLLADPRTMASKDKLNRIKGRESWRPTAPAVLRDQCQRYFNLADPGAYRYMTMIAASRGGAAIDIPAALHYDGTARVQVVDRGDAPLGQILTAFNDLTGCPVLLNTSLNGPGEPICNTVAHACQFFQNSSRAGLDVMAIGNQWIE